MPKRTFFPTYWEDKWIGEQVDRSTCGHLYSGHVVRRTGGHAGRCQSRPQLCHTGSRQDLPTVVQPRVGDYSQTCPTPPRLRRRLPLSGGVGWTGRTAVTCHMSRVTCHVSHVKIYLLYYFYNGLLPERQSHGHGASCFMRGHLNSGRLHDNMQSLQLVQRSRLSHDCLMTVS